MVAHTIFVMTATISVGQVILQSSHVGKFLSNYNTRLQLAVIPVSLYKLAIGRDKHALSEWLSHFPIA